MATITSRRIAITTFGSLGDLHPYLAVGQELARRGHQVVVITLPMFRERVEAAGLSFAQLHGATTETPSPELMRRVLLRADGVKYIIRELLMPVIRKAYADTLAAAEGADIFIAHPLTLATRLVAEVKGIPWVSTQLAPLSFSSAWDPPVLPGLGAIAGWHLPPGFYRALFRVAEWQVRRWLRPWDALRKELGLPDRGNPLFPAGQSKFGDLALFSSLLGQSQPDWPAQTVITGFAFFDQQSASDPALEAWLADGPPPVVFTLGSSAVMSAGDFFRESAKAARRVGVRALLLGAPADSTPELHGADILRHPYASYAGVFPRAAAVVHQGGVGTTAEALRAGRPMLVVPFGVDQPDNAARMARLGVGRVLRRRQYRAARVARELQHLLAEPGYMQLAERAGETIRSENGAAVAADAVERILQAR